MRRDAAELTEPCETVPDSGVPADHDDRRRRDVRRLDATYAVPVHRSLAAWRDRAAALRRRILLSAGLWPLPDRPPLAPRVVDRRELGAYAVAKVVVESRPGLLLTGNLYRPLRRPGPFPAVLVPHGHWEGGRLHHDEADSPRTFCANLAAQGYVAFSYDMVGYGDATALPHDLAGPREELWGVGLLGLQLWNGLRALDLLVSLPDVDPTRVGCAGASGGGTQTFLLAAVDGRVAAAAPVAMVSAQMQGGCACENAPGLRLDTTNVEIAALAAPRPLLLVSASGDWTRKVPTREYPAIREIYRLFGAEPRVANVHVDAGHNFNRRSREAVYAFFARWLLSDGAPPAPHERAAVPADDDLRLFPAGVRPPAAWDRERLTRRLVSDARASVARDRPAAADLDRFRSTYLPALRETLAAAWPDEVRTEPVASAEHGGFALDRHLLGRPGAGDALPAHLFRPAGWRGGRAALVVDAGGKAALVDAAGHRPGPLLGRLLADGRAVLAVDVFGVGEHPAAGAAAGNHPSVPFFTTYNRTDAALRVQDVLTALAALRALAPAAEPDLIGGGEAGLWCLLARPLAPRPPRAVADVAAFSTADDAAFVDRLFVPGLRRAGDFATALALAAPAPTLVHNAAGRFRATGVAALYRSLGRPEAFARRDAAADSAIIVGWLRG